MNYENVLKKMMLDADDDDQLQLFVADMVYTIALAVQTIEDDTKRAKTIDAITTSIVDLSAELHADFLKFRQSREAAA